MGRHESPAEAARPARSGRLRAAVCFGVVLVVAGSAGEFLIPAGMPAFLRSALTALVVVMAVGVAAAVRPRWFGRDR